MGVGERAREREREVTTASELALETAEKRSVPEPETSKPATARLPLGCQEELDSNYTALITNRFIATKSGAHPKTR